MKKIIILIAILCSFGMSKTINMMSWEPEYKYKSNDTYTRIEAKEYCEGKKQCQPKRETGNNYRIYQKIVNCPPMLTGKMDSYIGMSYKIRRFINVCYDETLYKAVKIEKYPSEYGFDYVWKIEKTPKAGVKFNLNKRN